MTPGSVFLGQVAIGDYRREFMKRIRVLLGSRLRVYVGDEYFYPSLKTRLPEGFPHVPLVNRFLAGRRALLQRGFVAPAVGAGVSVLELNPRILNVWCALILRKLLGRPTVLWGHAWPRSGSKSRSDFVRGIMRSLATVLLVYTEEQRHALMQANNARLNVVAAPNALYPAAKMTPVSDRIPSSFLYVGRLVGEKKVALAIQALALLRSAREVPSELLVVGEGPERRALTELAASLGVSDAVHFFGHVSDESHLKAFYEQSIAALSPGYAGLSLTQAFGFGVPMIIGDSEPHAPEIEAARCDFNCDFFEADNVEDLAACMENFYVRREAWRSRADVISHDCRSKYSVEVMAERFCDAIELAAT